MSSTQLNQNILQNQYINTINNLQKELFKVSPKLNKTTKLQASIFKLQRILIDENQKSIETYVNTFKHNIPDNSFLVNELQKLAQITKDKTNSIENIILNFNNNFQDIIKNIDDEKIQISLLKEHENNAVQINKNCQTTDSLNKGNL